MTKRVASIVAKFAHDRDGIAMTEAIITVPFLTLLTVGILEFSAILWQREQVETGLRDAARYMARCRHAVATCETTARNLAFYGSTASTGPLRLFSWNPDTSNVSFSPVDGPTYATVSAETTYTYLNSPLFGWLEIDDITVTSNHDQRVIGW